MLRVGNFYTNDSWYYSDLELGDKYYADYGDLLYTWSATFGPHIWLGDKVIYHYHIWKIDLSNQLEKQFAVQLLEQDKANILSSKNGSTMVHVKKERMEQKDVIIPPSIKEQKKIGAFFIRLDHLITLQQRKLGAINLTNAIVLFDNGYNPALACELIILKGVLTYAKHHYQKRHVILRLL